jgi:hypothetical protein
MSKKLIWTNEIIEELIELLFCPFVRAVVP